MLKEAYRNILRLCVIYPLSANTMVASVIDTEPTIVLADFQCILYVNTIPVTDAIKTNGASLTKKYSKPCSNVPATANSGLLKSQSK